MSDQNLRECARQLFAILFLGLTLCLPCFAGDRFAALSMLESGDNDFAVGKHGEVSRYQFLPELWPIYSDKPVAWATNNAVSKWVAYDIMADRDKAFIDREGHIPTDIEFALLWHSPARVDHPTKDDLDYARRFENLCSRKP